MGLVVYEIWSGSFFMQHLTYKLKLVIMLKQFIDWVIIFLVALAGFIHLLRLIFLVFKPRILKRFDFISNPVPTKINLVLYYILVTGICIYVIHMKLTTS